MTRIHKLPYATLFCTSISLQATYYLVQGRASLSRTAHPTPQARIPDARSATRTLRECYPTEADCAQAFKRIYLNTSV